MFGKLQDCISTAITFCKSHKGWLCILIVAVILAIIFLPQCRYTIVKVQNGIYRTDNFTGKTVFIRGIRIMECVDECEIKESPKPVAVYTPPKPTVVYTQPKPAQPRYIPPKSIVRNLTSNEIAKVSCEVESSKYTGGSPFVRGRFHNGNRNIHITAIEVELCNIHPIAELKKDVQVYAIKTDIAPLTMRNHSFETVKFYRSSFKWRIVSAKGKVTLEEIDWDSLPIITPKATVGIP